MNKLVLLIFCTTSLLSCTIFTNDEETDLIGKWELSQILSDPGDGSGTFRDIDSNKTIQFFSGGTILSRNGTLCGININSDDDGIGTFSLDEKRISPANCEFDFIKPSFEIEGNTLIINYPCIERCSEKYRKK